MSTPAPSPEFSTGRLYRYASYGCRKESTASAPNEMMATSVRILVTRILFPGPAENVSCSSRKVYVDAAHSTANHTRLKEKSTII